MTGCFWCGRSVDDLAGFELSTEYRVVCLRCAPNQGQTLDPEFDEVFQPTPLQIAALRRLKQTLLEDGIRVVAREPEEKEWLDLNEERFLFSLHEGRAVPD